MAGASSFNGDTLSVTGVAQAVSGGGVPECRVGNDRPPPSSLDDVVSEREPWGLLSRGKAKSTASRSINKLRDMVAPAILGRSSRKPSHLPKPTVVTVTPRAPRPCSQCLQHQGCKHAHVPDGIIMNI